MSARFWLGTSSWGERAWVGSFYPPGMAARDFLAYYATRFKTVEADNTYYAIPRAELVAGWRRRTPEGFLLAAKFPRSIVHGGGGPRPDGARLLLLDRCARERDAFLEVMGRLGDRLGPLLLQFPYFRREIFSGPEPFFERLEAFLDSLPHGLRYAVEIRNRAWYGERLLEILRSRGVALAWVELGYLPPPWRLAPDLDWVTADFIYARLIGDRRRTEAVAERFDRIVLDKSESLDHWAELLWDARSRVRHVFAYANNHYAGHGPATIQDLATRLARLGWDGDGD